MKATSAAIPKRWKTFPSSIQGKMKTRIPDFLLVYYKTVQEKRKKLI